MDEAALISARRLTQRLARRWYEDRTTIPEGFKIEAAQNGEHPLTPFLRAAAKEALPGYDVEIAQVIGGDPYLVIGRERDG